MRIKITHTIFCFVLVACQSFAQDTPGGIGTTDGLSNLQLWLSAGDLSSGYIDGQQVFQWNDKSGADNHVYAPTDSAPFFRENVSGSHPGIEFMGQQYLQTNGASASFFNPESTIFLVKTGDFEGASIALASSGWMNEMLLFDNIQYHHSSSGNNRHLTHHCINNIPDEEPAIICGIFGQAMSDISYFVNGLASSNNIAGNGSPWDYTAVNRIVTIGQRDQFVPSEYLTGTILEVIVYNNKLTNEERQSVEEYLRCKYEIMPSVCSALGEEICPTTSNKNIAAGMQVRLFPNPANDVITASITGHLQDTDLQYVIFDQLGRNLAAGISSSENMSIDVSDFPAGIYFIRMHFDDIILLEKFIVE